MKNAAEDRRPANRDLPELATRAEVAEYANLSIATLARWAGEGKGPQARKLGGAVRYRREDVLAWIENAAAKAV